MTVSKSKHFLSNDHSDNHMLLIFIEKLKTGHDSIRKAREARYICKETTLVPLGINKCVMIYNSPLYLVYNKS